jgi:uncharacterized protein (TIGR00369 family)
MTGDDGRSSAGDGGRGVDRDAVMSELRDRHFVALERMYVSAPVNAFYRPRIGVSEAAAWIEIDADARFHHAAGAVHGSVYFKMLDDAAFFAANSLEREVFVLTTSFTTYLTRPVSAGMIRSVGRVVSRTRSQFIAEATVEDAEGREIGRGSGVFVRGRTRLENLAGYAAP